MSFRKLALGALAALLIGSAAPARAGSYDLSWNTVDGGGCTSEGGSYSLTGTIGQADAGTMSGPGYELHGGFWSLHVVTVTAFLSWAALGLGLLALGLGGSRLMRHSTRAALVAALFLLASGSVLAAGMGTDFTYQGRLIRENHPFTGTCDVRLSLYDKLILGSQVGATQIDTIEVDKGIFTLELNGASEFGSSAFSGDVRYLAIEVKCPGDTDFTALTPRQKLMPAPFAMGLALPYSGKYSTGGGTQAFRIENTGEGRALTAVAGTDTAIWGVSSGGFAGVDGRNTTGYGVYGTVSDAAGTGIKGTGPGLGVLGTVSGTTNAVGVAGQANNSGCGLGLSGCRGVQGVSESGYGVEGYVTGGGIAVHAVTMGSGAALVATGQLSGNLIEAWHGPMFPNRRFTVTDGGEVYADGTFHPGGADFAELLPGVSGLEPGDVLVIGPDGKLARSTEPYQTTLAGVHSTRPGMLGGSGDGVSTVGKVQLAVVGVVPVKVTDEGGPIRPGDALTSSSTPGHAMKAAPITVGGISFLPSGVILGKSLGTLESGSGVVEALVVPQ